MKVLILLGLIFTFQVYGLIIRDSSSLEEGIEHKLNEASETEEFLTWIEDEDLVKWFTTRIRDAIINALEDIRQIMREGIPDLGIPQLDPLTLGNTAFNVTIEGDQVYGNLTTSEVVGLSNFVTAQVLVGLLAMNYDIGLSLETLELHGLYNMDGHALGMHVFGDGNYTIDLNRSTFSLSLDLGIGKYISIKNLWADLKLKDAKVQFDHLLGGGVIGQLVNDALSEELPVILHVLEDATLPPLLNLIQNKTNEYLQQFPLIPDFNFTQIDRDYDW